MGDRTYATIRFSGVIDRDKVDDLVGWLEDQGCQPDNGGEIADNLNGWFYDTECNYGTMDGVETFCQEVGISYLKCHDSGDNYEAGVELYNALVDKTFDCGTYDGEPMLPISDLLEYRDEGTLDSMVDYLKSLRVSEFEKNYPPLEIREPADG
jgi:hypothetical protein